MDKGGDNWEISVVIVAVCLSDTGVGVCGKHKEKRRVFLLFFSFRC